MGTEIRNWFLTGALSAILCLALSACTDTPTYAPVYEIANIEPVITKLAAPVKSTRAMPPAPVHGWNSPVDVHNAHKYLLANKGVDIYGKRGEPIVAAASGKIVFCGSGLRGYGNLIIIKHNNEYLSVYAHTQAVLIKPGDWVKAGQSVASMGSSGTKQIKLHFEIRHLGKPLNPLILLRQKSV